MTLVKVQNYQLKTGKLPSDTEEETLWNNLCVSPIGPYKIRSKGKHPLLLKAVTTIYPITRWFEITKCSDKKAMKIANLVKNTWLVQYPWPVEIMSD